MEGEIAGVPCKFVTNFDPTYPVILGGLLNVEENIGYVQVKDLSHYFQYFFFLFIFDEIVFFANSTHEKVLYWEDC